MGYKADSSGRGAKIHAQFSLSSRRALSPRTRPPSEPALPEPVALPEAPGMYPGNGESGGSFPVSDDADHCQPGGRAPPRGVVARQRQRRPRPPAGTHTLTHLTNQRPKAAIVPPPPPPPPPPRGRGGRAVACSARTHSLWRSGRIAPEIALRPRATAASYAANY